MSANYPSVPAPTDTHLTRGYGTTTANDFAQGNPSATTTSPLSQSMHHPSAFHDEPGSDPRGTSVTDDGSGGFHRANSTASTAVPAATPIRSNTLKKKSSMRRTTSLKRSSSKKSLKAGSIAGYGGQDRDKDFNNVFTTPVPTQGTPTEVLANRFQAWRQLLKSLITYFREIQASYEQRAKTTQKVHHVMESITHPALFMRDNGLSEATKVLDEYHKRTIAEANKSREIENDVIGALTGLRSDLGQKIKEIKSLSGDFKNSVEKEQDGTRREVEKYQEALRSADHDDGSAMGKNDPFVVRLGVDRAVERQLDEENYLHRAYLNLESSGRELESIVVGEIQKAYNALAGILKREGDDAYHAVESLRTGPISMPKDAEWKSFVQNDSHFVDPDLPIRRFEDIEYPGKHHPAAAEVRSGMLERKSKYLKSYTPGWYVLSPTHLHEFKSADKLYTQPPVMSLYLPDQKLGSHSQDGSSSHKFMVKGKQSSGVHKGHNWVFRAETYDTMMAWFEDMRNLTEKTGEERNAFVRKHARSVSGTSDRGTVSSDGLEEDEADEVPYSADVASLAGGEGIFQPQPKRPAPGGRFPSDLQVPRERAVSMGQSSGTSSDDRDVVAAAGGLPGSEQLGYGGQEQDDYRGQDPYRLDGVSAGTHIGQPGGYFEQTPPPPEQMRAQPVETHQPSRGHYEQRQQPEQLQQQSYEAQQSYAPPQQQSYEAQQQQSFLGPEPAFAPAAPARHESTYGDWMAPAAGAVGVVGVAGAGAVAYNRHQEEEEAARARAYEEAARASAMPPLTPEVPEKSELRSSEPLAGGLMRFNQNEGGIGRAVEPAVDQQPGFAAPTVMPPAQESLTGNVVAFRQNENTAERTIAAPTPATAPTVLPTAQPATDPSTAAPTSTASTTAAARGGLEAEGARETGTFPKVVRHNTNMSISQLHVPGQYPKQI